MADILRISPWSTPEVRDALRRHQIQWLLGEAQKAGIEPVIYLNIDNSLGPKGKKTHQPA